MAWTSANCCSIAARSYRLICATAPDKPGQHHAYHALTSGFVVAALVEKITGRSFRAFFREQISGPLGLASLDFGARGAVLSRWRATTCRACGCAASGPLPRRAIGTGLAHAIALSNDPASTGP